MRKQDGWCIWTPWAGYLTDTLARTRSKSIAEFERAILSPWRKYRQKGFECRPVRLVDARYAEAIEEDRSHD